MSSMEEKINRINELYHKSQETELTPEEKEEQKALRQEYILAIRGSIKASLDNVDIVEKDGTVTHLKDLKKVKK